MRKRVCWIIEKAEQITVHLAKGKTRKKTVRTGWDYEYESAAAAQKVFDKKYRNPGGPKDQDFFVVKVTVEDVPFKPAKKQKVKQ